MMILWALLLALFLCISTPVFGIERVDSQSCSTVDLRDQFGPVRDQQDASWCNSFAHADLLSFFVGERISASDHALGGITLSRSPHEAARRPTFDLRQCLEQRGSGRSGALDSIRNCFDYVVQAAEFRNRLTRNPEDEAVDEHAAFIHLDQNGYCRESDAPSENFANPIPQRRWLGRRAVPTPNNSIGNQMWFIRWLHEEARHLPDGELLCASTPALNAIRNLFPGLGSRSLSEITSIMKSPQFLQHLVDASCPNRQRLVSRRGLNLRNFSHQISSDARSSDDRDFNGLIRSLMDSRHPAVVGVDMNQYLPRLLQAPHSGHAMVLVGRQWDPASHRCLYILRNSWGESCAGLAKGVRCERGHLFVDEETLARSVTGVETVAEIEPLRSRTRVGQ